MFKPVIFQHLDFFILHLNVSWLTYKKVKSHKMHLVFCVTICLGARPANNDKQKEMGKERKKQALRLFFPFGS